MNKNQKGVSTVLILLIIAAAVLAIGVIYVGTQMGGQVSIPAPVSTQYQYGTIPTPTPSGPEIQTLQDLDSANKQLDGVNIDGSMNADLNGLSTDASSL